MAFHEIKIGTKNFTLAPKYIKSPDTAATNADYGFLLFKYDESNSSISQLYSAGLWDTPLIKYSSGHISAGCNILPDGNNNCSVGSSNLKFNTMYATTFHGDLDGHATEAAAAFSININTKSTNATYYVTFTDFTTGVRTLSADAGIKYNPSTNTLTTTQVDAKLNGPLQTTATSTNASYYITFVNSSSTGMRYSYVDSGLYYNPSTNVLTTTQVNANINGAVQTTATSTSATYYISFVNSSSTGMRYSYVDSGLYYNPSTNVLTTTGHINATNGFYETSDEQLKDFQEDIEVNFSYLRYIPKKYYYWKDDATYTRHIGTSAQEVQKYYPELVNTDDDGYLTMNYDKLSVVALKAIDVLHEEITELKKENAELKERLERLEELILNK